MTDLVSAIIPTYNYGRFVGRAIQSVLSQTHPAMECIVVDDGSTDETRQVLARYAERIVMIRQDRRGVSSARNRAIAAARGEFVALLDGDDWWKPRKIETQLALLRSRPDLGCVGCGFEHVYPDGRIDRFPGRANVFSRPETLRRVARRTYWVGGSGSGALIRRSVLDRLGGFDELLAAAEDWDMWVRLAADSTIDNVSEVLVSISRHGTGVFRDARLMETNQWKVYRKLTRERAGVLNVWDRRRLRAAILADAARESRGSNEALVYYIRSLGAWPFSHKPARALAALAARRLFMRGRAASRGLRWSQS